MKIKSLLAAVSMVAITAGSANALVLTNNTVGGTVTPALELETPITPAATFGSFVFDVAPNPGAQYPGGANLVVKVQLPSGIVFTNDVTGSDIGNAVSSATVQNGSGTAGTNEVEFLASIFASVSGGQPISFNLPLSVSDCPAGDVRVIIETESGTPIEEGSVTGTGANALFASCDSAIDGVVLSDESTSDTIITLVSGYTALQETDPVTGANISAPNTVGTINYTIDPTVSVSRSGNTAGQPLVATDVDELNFTLMLEDASAMTNAFVRTDGGLTATGVKNGDNFDFNITSPAIIADMVNGVADDIRIVVDQTTVITTQSLKVVNSSVSFRDTGLPDLIMSEQGAEGNLDALQREGREFGYFDWNAGPAIGDPTLSVYRITGLDAGMPVDYTLTLENSNNNGTYAGTVTANSYGEAQLVSTLMPVPADTERFDVLINLETPNDDVDVDRLMLRTGIVTAFNDGANNDQEDSREPNLNDSDN